MTRLHRLIAMAAIAAPSVNSRIRFVTGDTRRTPSVAPTMINATIAPAV